MSQTTMFRRGYRPRRSEPEHEDRLDRMIAELEMELAQLKAIKHERWLARLANYVDGSGSI